MKNLYMLLLLLSSAFLGAQVEFSFLPPPVSCQGDTVVFPLVVQSDRAGVSDLFVYVEVDTAELVLIDVVELDSFPLLLQAFDENPNRYSISREADASGVGEGVIDFVAGDTLAMVTAIVTLTGEGTITVTEGFSVFRSNLSYLDESDAQGFAFVELPALELLVSTIIPVVLDETTGLSCAQEQTILSILGDYPSATQFELLLDNEPVGVGQSKVVNQGGLYQWRVTRSVCETIVDVEVPTDTVFGARPQVQSAVMQCGATTARQEVVNASDEYIYSWEQQGGGVVGEGGVFNAVPGTYWLRTTRLRNGCEDIQEVVVEAASVTDELAAVTLPDTLLLTCLDTGFVLAVDLAPEDYAHEFRRNGDLLEGTSLSALEVTEPGVYVLHIAQLTNNCTRDRALIVLEDVVSPTVELTATNVSCTASARLVAEVIGNVGLSWVIEGVVVGSNTSLELTESATVTLVATNNETGCQHHQSVAITDERIYPEVIVDLPAPPECGTDQVVLTITTDPENTITAHHEVLGSLNGTAGLFAVTADGIIDYTVTAPAGCSTRDTVLLEGLVSPLRFEDIQAATLDCSDEYADASVYIGLAGGGALPLTYYLNGEAVDAGILQTVAGGEQFIEVVDANGCSVDTIITIDNEVITATILGVRASYSVEEEITLSAEEVQGLPEEAYLWRIGDREYTGPTLSFIAEESAHVILEVASSQGCLASDTIRVNVSTELKVFFPTAFSPNGDGVNDRFVPEPAPELRGMGELKIYDRWGGLVYEERGNVQEMRGWDGVVDGLMVPRGVYIYLYTYSQGRWKYIKGEVTRI